MKLLISSGRGPAECRLAVLRTVKLIGDEAHQLEIDATVIDDRWPDDVGPSSSVIVLNGCGVEAFAQTWIGSIQHVIKSSLRPNHGRKNWFVSVCQIPEQPETVALSEGDVRFEAFRSGGPGGQHQNTTDSAIRATHCISNLSVVVRSERSQHQNKRIALKRLGELLQAQNDLAQGRMVDLIRQQHEQLQRGNPVRTIRDVAR